MRATPTSLDFLGTVAEQHVFGVSVVLDGNVIAFVELFYKATSHLVDLAVVRGELLQCT